MSVSASHAYVEALTLVWWYLELGPVVSCWSGSVLKGLVFFIRRVVIWAHKVAAACKPRERASEWNWPCHHLEFVWTSYSPKLWEINCCGQSHQPMVFRYGSPGWPGLRHRKWGKSRNQERRWGKERRESQRGGRPALFFYPTGDDCPWCGSFLDQK